MSLTVEAIYSNGMLKLAGPLPLKENERVNVTIVPERSLAERTAGLIQWKDDAETFDRVLAEAEDSEGLP